MSKTIQIVEVGPRDGLQNESVKLSSEQKAELCLKLVNAGLKRVEIGAFVSPKWVPQMANSDQVISRVLSQLDAKKALALSALVPNARGMDDALKTKIKEVAIFGSCSETFSQKNINCSIEESFVRFADVVKLAKKNKIKVRGYLSMAFGCPYEGDISPKKVVELAKKLLKLGVYEVSIGDTIGIATPKQVHEMMKQFKKAKIPLEKVALHLHDTRGTALANVLAGIEEGIQIFDSSVTGLGGCPYAKGAAGNLATEDLIYMVHGMGFKTGVDLEKLIEIRPWLTSIFQKDLPGRTSRAGLPKVNNN